MVTSSNQRSGSGISPNCSIFNADTNHFGESMAAAIAVVEDVVLVLGGAVTVGAWLGHFQGAMLAL
jgi:hypothetical protein